MTASYSSQQVRMAEITAKCTASLSLISSLRLIYEIFQKPRAKRSTLHKILLGMSFFDIGACVPYIVGSWAFPHDLKQQSANAFQPSGNHATCVAAGFWLQLFCLTTPMYNLSLAVYYYLNINQSWKESKMKNYLWIFHAIPVLFGMSTAIFGLAAQQFGPAELWCWLSGTSQSVRLRIICFYLPVWSVFLVNIILFSIMYRRVRQQEHANRKYQFENYAISQQRKLFNHYDNNNQDQQGQPQQQPQQQPPAQQTSFSKSLSRPIFTQGLLFALGFVLTFLFPSIVRFQAFIHSVSSSTSQDFHVHYTFVFLVALFLPLQGFFNYMAFKRHHILKWFSTVQVCEIIQRVINCKNWDGSGCGYCLAVCYSNKSTSVVTEQTQKEEEEEEAECLSNG